ncbi:portal protein [Enterocloster lavalensis]|uniref:portal protein n=1 Tax=Enterocloster lavalensis TaxID=460384 RepID=UPI000D1B5FB7|nr:hypothetical protein [Enterocloster lavalensis]PST28272.1 hypothetical protein C7256_29400 [Enterocloster lavalensis]
MDEENITTTEQAEQPIDTKEIDEALQTLLQYKRDKQALTDRIVNAEEWWKNNHWDRFSSASSNSNDTQPVSAWLFNSIINKHADFMDNFPCPAILEREESDREIAKMLSSVVPVILEQNGFERTYSECSWDKPKIGTAIYGVFWNPEKENGLGDIDIKHMDVINMFWEAGVEDIQKSRNVFTVEMMDRDLLEEEYPEIKGKNQAEIIYKPEYLYESNLDTTNKVQVIDWYYKKRIRADVNGIITTKTILHYCKFIPGAVLYATENDPEMQYTGWYDHGMYPFVCDTMFPEKGSPAGFGYLDIMVNPQEYIDKLDQVILKNAMLNRPRYFVSNSAGINEQEFADMSNDFVHCSGSVDESQIQQIKVPQMSDGVFKIREEKIEELKETSGNRDFSQGGTTSGVTAASAIAALQEAGSKLSRDMIKGTYTAYSSTVTMVIELIRQFYTLPRCYRITQPNGEAQYIELTNESLQPQQDNMMDGELSARRPVFDIKVAAQKASPYSRIANNELAKELFGMGVFNPQIADQAMAVVTMMDFDRRDEVLKKIQENGLMYQQLQQMQAAMVQMADIIAQTTGNTQLLDAVGQMAGPAQTGINVNPQQVRTNSLGAPVSTDNSQAGQARERVATATEVRA